MKLYFDVDRPIRQAATGGFAHVAGRAADHVDQTGDVKPIDGRRQGDRRLCSKHRISGAPVVDQEGRFLGIFSEKTSMSVAGSSGLRTTAVDRRLLRSWTRILVGRFWKT
jgi:hypothetical protein